jgi:hypothetical protein
MHDLVEAVRKMVLAAGTAGELSVSMFKEVTPPTVSAEESETLIEMLNAAGVWIVED